MSSGTEELEEGASASAVEGSEAPVKTEEEPEVAVSDETGKEGTQEDDEENGGVDLKAMADDYAKYLIVNSKQDQTTLDDRIDGVYTRVDEFKQQLYFLHQNIASNSDKTQELYENTQQLTALFHKIDQMESFLNTVSRNVDHLEAAVSAAEKDLEPSKIRKVFSSIPGLGRKSAPKPDTSGNWQAPKVFKTKDYFSRGSTTSPSPSIASSSTSSFGGPPDEQLLTQQLERAGLGQQRSEEGSS